MHKVDRAALNNTLQKNQESGYADSIVPDDGYEINGENNTFDGASLRAYLLQIDVCKKYCAEIKSSWLTPEGKISEKSTKQVKSENIARIDRQFSSVCLALTDNHKQLMGSYISQFQKLLTDTASTINNLKLAAKANDRKEDEFEAKAKEQEEARQAAKNAPILRVINQLIKKDRYRMFDQQAIQHCRTDKPITATSIMSAGDQNCIDRNTLKNKGNIQVIMFQTECTYRGQDTPSSSSVGMAYSGFNIIANRPELLGCAR